MCILRAASDWCNAAAIWLPVPPILRKVRDEVEFELQSFPQGKSGEMTYQMACDVARGLLQYLRIDGQWRELVWSIEVSHRRFGAGKLWNMSSNSHLNSSNIRIPGTE